METFLRDVSFSFRMLGRRPGFTVAALIGLGLSIGANTAIFSMVNSIVLRQLPFKDSERLVWVWSTRTDRDKAPFSVPDFLDERDQNQTLEHMSAFSDWSANLTGGGDSERIQGLRISANVFRMLGVEAVAGRALIPEDDNAGSAPVVVVTHGLWKRRFGGDPGLVGRTLTLNDESYTVVGVLPPNFVFPGTRAELAIPIRLEVDPRRTERDSNFLRAIARLKPGVTQQQAQADLTSIARNLQEQYPKTNARKTSVTLVSLRDHIVGDYQAALLMIMGAVGLVLLIACANIGNLLLARSSARTKEIAIRMALGASRGRLIRQLLTESVLLAVLGGMLGLFLAHLGRGLLMSLTPADLPRASEVDTDWRVLGFTLGLSVLVGIIFGLAPALVGSKANLSEDLKAGSRGTTGGNGRSRTRGFLVISEVGLSLMLLISAGLFVKSFTRLQQVDPGFNAENLLVVSLSLPKTRYSDRASVVNFYDKIAPRIQSLPGVKSVGAASILPLSGLIARVDYVVVGRPPVSASERPSAQARMVSPDYFTTMGIPILRGRDFSTQDTPRSQPVAVISEALANTYWPSENAIGAHLMIDDGPELRDVEVVGVVGNVKHIRLDEEPSADIYVPFHQIPDDAVAWLINTMSLMVRTNSEPLAMAGAVRQEVHSVDATVPASSHRTMEQLISASIAPRRFNLLLVGAFAAVALLLAATGIYAVISYAVTQRTQEIGIRMALGAQPAHVMGLIVRQTLTLLIMGVVAGLIGAAASTSLIASLLFRVNAIDIPTFVLTSVLLICVGLLASYLPARRAMRVNPLTALRAE
jgi:putative ABC transport system permease protein